MEYKELSREVVTSLKGSAVRQHQQWTFVVYKGKSYGFKGTIQQLKEHGGAFELTTTINEETGEEFGHLHLAEVL